MPRYNKTILMGHLVRDTEVKDVGDKKLYKNCLAVNERKYGDKEPEPLFIEFDLWGKKAELLAEWAGKGDTVLLEGRLKLDRWLTKDDEKRSQIRLSAYEFEVVKKKGDHVSDDVPF